MCLSCETLLLKNQTQLCTVARISAFHKVLVHGSPWATPCVHEIGPRWSHLAPRVRHAQRQFVSSKFPRSSFAPQNRMCWRADSSIFKPPTRCNCLSPSLEQDYRTGRSPLRLDLLSHPLSWTRPASCPVLVGMVCVSDVRLSCQVLPLCVAPEFSRVPRMRPSRSRLDSGSIWFGCVVLSAWALQSRYRGWVVSLDELARIADCPASTFEPGLWWRVAVCVSQHHSSRLPIHSHTMRSVCRLHHCVASTKCHCSYQPRFSMRRTHST